MAIKYKFSCLKCDYKEQIYIGTTKIAIKQGELPFQLGSCADCRRLFSNKIKQCSYCFKNELPSFKILNWFRVNFTKASLSSPLKFYKEDEVKKIPCPLCSHHYLKSNPIIFYD